VYETNPLLEKSYREAECQYNGFASETKNFHFFENGPGKIQPERRIPSAGPAALDRIDHKSVFLAQSLS
jgi:hypothetical protein